MEKRNIPIGRSDFGEIQREEYYYVDKTGLIREILRTEGTKVTLFTRPRRFGKTMAMSMLAHFFDISKDSEELFQGLEIYGEKALCEKWMNQYPVVFVTFKDIDGLTFQVAYERLQGMLADLFKEFEYLQACEEISEDDKKIFAQIKAEQANMGQISRSLKLLIRMLSRYYQKPVILLLDEYDVPVSKANHYGYYEQMLDVIRGILSTALKDNSFLKFAVITGCLRITKESIFTGVNNFTIDTISDKRYDEFFGFTKEEAAKLLEDTGLTDQAEMIQKWYDGYQFGNMDIYCPWDVMNYVNKVMTQKMERPENFWANTSDNAIIRNFLERADFDVTEKFEILLDGGCIMEEVDENLTYDYFTASETDLWSLLYSTGYLTKAKNREQKDGKIALKIPNAEVMDIFRKSVVEWFNRKAAVSDRKELFTALWNGESEKLTELLSDLLFDTISFHDYAESFYHAFMTGLAAGVGYIVESNFENGLGRSDIVIKDRKKRRAAVIEAKIAPSEEKMEQECQEALRQIETKQYARKIERSGFKTVLRYGIAFYRKSCLVKQMN